MGEVVSLIRNLASMHGKRNRDTIYCIVYLCLHLGMVPNASWNCAMKELGKKGNAVPWLCLIDGT